ncbi:hypothetical protein FOZ60_007989 [Perkinsus olseni]|uniref:Uncharacterized protein n=1 Tax=Perkinsus olseni TaxID=32597 RepID=A0A7J6NKF8_PEROL|nr:hypothetical protein FOZ60_007989 [Perkinsus olseni]
MISSIPLINIRFWCIALIGSLLVYLTGAEPYRQQEVLYGRVRGDEGAEFFLLPRVKAAIGSLSTAQNSGLSKHSHYFPDKTKGPGPKPQRTGLHTYDFLPHNTLKDNNNVVNQTRILRVEEGETKEYAADVVEGDKCFDNIRELEDSQGRVSKVAPENIQEELAELCQSGFSALQPSPDSPLVDGFYTGTRMERNVSLEVHDGKMMGAGLTVKRVGEDCRSITYYPVCDGMLAIIVPADKLPTEDKAYYVMLKKSEKPKKRSKSFLSRLRRKRSDEGNSDDVELQSLHAGNQGSHPLCNAAHERRKLNRDELLEKWDRNMPEDFVLKLVY